jgi:hypothetical protein
MIKNDIDVSSQNCQSHVSKDILDQLHSPNSLAGK